MAPPMAEENIYELERLWVTLHFSLEGSREEIETQRKGWFLFV
jgi:hypothetical protein